MGTHDRGRPGISTGCTELASSLDDALDRGDWVKVQEIDRRRTYQYGAWRAAIHTLLARKGVCTQFLFEVLIHPAQILRMVYTNAQ
jgi:hypothetical protein